MGNYAHFSQYPGQWEESTQVLWGSHNICPSLTWFKVGEITQLELLALSHTQAWGSIEKPQGNMAFLPIVLGKTIKGEMAFRLAMVWEHLHQPWLSSLHEVARKLTLLIDLGDNWTYALVRLNEDAQHVPLSNKGHLSAMIDGVPSRSTCRHLCQLEVCKLLQYGDQVVYPKELNGGLKPVQTSLSGPLLWGQDALGSSTHEPSFLLMDLFWVTLRDHMPKAPAPYRASTPSSPSHLTMEHHPKTDGHISITAEVQEFYHMLCLTPPARHWGTPPQRGQHQHPWGLHSPPEWKTLPSQ